MLLAGIDESGRGPLIGPLVIAAVAIEEKFLPYLDALKLKDSKALTRKQRSLAYEKIIKLASYKIIIIEPIEIDQELNSDSSNLNWLEAKKIAELINDLNPDKAIIDCPSPNIGSYTNYLKALLKNPKTELICEHKADVNYPIVSAASILAKVTRDKEIKEIQKMIPEDIGSGYPSDPVTQRFLKENYEKYPEIFRKTWLPYRLIKDSKKQSSLKKFLKQ